MGADPLWRVLPCDFKLSEHEVHVWRAALDRPPSQEQALQQSLSEDEFQKSERFYFDHDRHHYVVARGLLRTLLGHYLRLPPAQLQFSYNPHGKPILASRPEQAPLAFSLSHSGGLALYAFAHNRAVGIDLEQIRTNIKHEQMVEHVFSPAERHEFHMLPADQKIEAFFNGWTRKEAYIKARGQGLALPLDQFDVTLRPDQPARLLRMHNEPLAAQHWSLQELVVAPGYKAALVVEGQDHRLTCWQWSG